MDKMVAVSKRKFKIPFLEWIVSYFDSNITEDCSQIRNSIMSDNILLPGGTKPLPDTMLIYHPQGPSYEGLKIPISKTRMKIAYLKSHPDLPGINEFIHWGGDEMDSIFQTTCLNAFSWMKIFQFQIKVHGSLLLRDQLTVSQHWLR